MAMHMQATSISKTDEEKQNSKANDVIVQAHLMTITFNTVCNATHQSQSRSSPSMPGCEPASRYQILLWERRQSDSALRVRRAVIEHQQVGLKVGRIDVEGRGTVGGNICCIEIG